MNATLRCVRITVKYNPQKSTLPKDSSALPQNDGKYAFPIGEGKRNTSLIHPQGVRKDGIKSS